MTKRLLLAGLYHETHTFLEGRTGLADFEVRRGCELLTAAGDGSPLAGAVEAARELGWELVPTIDHRALPGPIVEDAAVEGFWCEFEELSRPALSRGIDGVYLILHGAMVSESLDDVEGEVLARIRRLLGKSSAPIGGVFDLHANFTAAMAQHSDALVAYRENPHVDAEEAARRAARLLDRVLSHRIRCATAWLPAGLLWPPTGTATAEEPMR